MKWKGVRKVAFGALALGVLGGAFALCAWKPEANVSFPAFATAVCAIVAAFTAGNVGEHAAQRGQGTKP
jgi:hypothetical protein